MLWRVSWALAQISCYIAIVQNIFLAEEHWSHTNLGIWQPTHDSVCKDNSWIHGKCRQRFFYFLHFFTFLSFFNFHLNVYYIYGWVSLAWCLLWARHCIMRTTEAVLWMAEWWESKRHGHVFLHDQSTPSIHIHCRIVEGRRTFIVFCSHAGIGIAYETDFVSEGGGHWRGHFLDKVWRGAFSTAPTPSRIRLRSPRRLIEARRGLRRRHNED